MADNTTAIPSPDVLKPIAAGVVGPMFIGNMLNWMLMGTLIVQVYHYLTYFRGDKLPLKILVYVLVILDSAQTIMCTQTAWHYAVDIWSEPEQLNGEIPWTAAVIPIVGGLVSMGVQFFYAWRVWTLGRNWFLKTMAIIICAVSFSQGMSAFVAGIIGAPHTKQETLLRLHPAFTIWLAGSFTADTLITACMLWILYTAKTNSPFVRSEALINRLISNTIQTGAITVIVATIDLALFVRFTSTTYHFVPAFILGKLYTNSFMATLNARKSGKSMTQTTTDFMSQGSYGMSEMNRPANAKASQTAFSNSTSLGASGPQARTFINTQNSSVVQPEKSVDLALDDENDSRYKRGIRVDIESGRHYG